MDRKIYSGAFFVGVEKRGGVVSLRRSSHYRAFGPFS